MMNILLIKLLSEMGMIPGSGGGRLGQEREEDWEGHGGKQGRPGYTPEENEKPENILNSLFR